MWGLKQAAMLLTLRMQKWAMVKECSSRSWRRQGNGVSPVVSHTYKVTVAIQLKPFWHLDLGPVRLILVLFRSLPPHSAHTSDILSQAFQLGSDAHTSEWARGLLFSKGLLQTELLIYPVAISPFFWGGRIPIFRYSLLFHLVLCSFKPIMVISSLFPVLGLITGMMRFRPLRSEEGSELLGNLYSVINISIQDRGLHLLPLNIAMFWCNACVAIVTLWLWGC